MQTQQGAKILIGHFFAEKNGDLMDKAV